MSKKGFTLVELLAIIVIIALIAVIVAPNVIETYWTSKQQAYDILIENIKIAGENYYKECEFGTMIEEEECTATAKKEEPLSVTLGRLAELGLLKGSAEATTDDLNNTTVTYEYKTVINPKTNDPINDCEIEISKLKEGSIVKYNYCVKDPDNCSIKDFEECSIEFYMK